MRLIFLLCLCVLFNVKLIAQVNSSRIEAVNFSKVSITDAFWKPRIDGVSKYTIPVCIDQTEVKTPRIRNFEKVSAGKGEKHEGIFEKIIQQNPKTNSRYAIERNNKILKCLIDLDQRVIPINILKTKEDKVKECFKKKP